jgi:histidinol-phosphate aminotransferase
MLSAWVQPETQAWLAQSREQLRGWKTQQLALLRSLGWVCLPSDSNYLCVQAPGPLNVAVLRAQGIKLRDTTSMGLPGHWRLSVQPPAAQAALAQALHSQQVTTV